jgi:ribosomal protein S12 methylthiotransferase accessory factor
MEITLPGGKKVDANYNGMTIKTDQPAMAGGDGSAPAPFDLFLASIGTCAGIYVQGFCQSRGIPTDNIKIIQHMNYNTTERMIDRIELEIKLPHDFPEKYKSAVEHAADHCAVKKHLQKAPVITVYSN